MKGTNYMSVTPIKGLRQYARIPFHADVLLHAHGERFKVQLVDIALKGALVQVDAPHTLALQDTCRLELPLAGSEGVVMSGSIVHLEQQHVGIACHSMDLSSLTRLRRLIELNTGDTEMMDRELSHLFR